ncbi:TrmH family RNA methyltransferase [Salinicoccus albus]|uniref:TrmH family RNA methyltransferase n=1 Tax=Salinicoccus albus TaxID=418756 RepID=UPI00037144FF|nr:RNA methyltransferase [Salinicoccus albus]
MVKEEIITSKDNGRIKELRKLQTKKHRKKADQFLIEGEHLVTEAILHNQKIHNVVLLEDYDYSHLDLSDIDLILVNEEVMNSLSTLETPPGIVAAISYSAPSKSSNRVLLLDFIQDPGNLGTLIRTADAFGFSKVILSPDTVDAYSGKVLRSAQGSTFHIEMDVMDTAEAIESFDGMVLGTSLKEAVPFENIAVNDTPLMLVLGNEGRGLEEELLDKADQRVKIEMPGDSESLNVAISGGILMHYFKA